MASTGLKARLRIPKLWVKAFTGTPPDRPEAIKTLVRMAERARREGLLALEEEAQDVDDPFLSKGLRLVVDGTDPELVKDILDLDVESMAGAPPRERRAVHARLAASRRRSASSAR